MEITTDALKTALENFSFENCSNTVARKLHNRSASKDLADRNIIHQGINVAPNLQAALQVLKFKTTATTISNKLEQRPNRFELIGSHILIDELDQNNSITFDQLVLLLSSKLSHRPSRAQLEETNIVKGSSEVAANLQSISAQLKFRLTALLLNHKIEQRPSMAQLIQNNVMKEHSTSVAPNLQAPQQSVKFQTISHQLYIRLEQRHSLEELMDSNIFKIDRESDLQTLENLDRKLGQRPLISELMSQNILRYNPSISQNFQAVYQSLNRQKLNFHLSHKLVLRPSKFVLEESNILKSEVESQKNEIVITLTGLIQHRPSEDELYIKQILISTM